MNIDRVTYKKLFYFGNTDRIDEVIGLECNTSEFDSIEEAFTTIKNLAFKLHKENKQLQKEVVIVVDNTPKSDREDEIIKQMDTCADANVLTQSYSFIASRYPKIQAAYNQKLEQLQQIHLAELQNK